MHRRGNKQVQSPHRYCAMRPLLGRPYSDMSAQRSVALGRWRVQADRHEAALVPVVVNSRKCALLIVTGNGEVFIEAGNGVLLHG